MNPSTTLVMVIAFAAAVCTSVSTADEPARSIKTEFLMTLRAPLDPATNINDSLSISNVTATGGRVQGPRIQGVLVPPGGERDL